jgi:uncharacterized membrane protein YbhN (UPF0104 family)
MRGRLSDHDANGPTRAAWWSIVLVLAAGLVLYALLPQLAGLDETWDRLARGDPWWLGAAVLLEVGSYAGYVLAFRRIFVGGVSRIGWRESYDITLAGVAATRLLATAGVGGIALTGWALSRAGMGRRELVSGLTTFYVVLYAVFMGALVVVGGGLRTGVLPGPAPFGVTVVPALFGAAVIGAGLLTALLPRDLERRLRARVHAHERATRWLGAAAAGAAAVAGGVRGALRLLRNRDPALLGALAWWAFDIAVLWACFRAFGDAPPVAVVVMGYFTGMLGNLLPLPGGVGGVEGGMIGAFLAFGVSGGLAVLAVLSYRAIAFWLPTIPGGLAYLRLRRTVRSWSHAPRGAGP